MKSRRRERVGVLAVSSAVLVGLGAPAALAATPAGTPSVTSVVAGHADWIAQAYENTATGIYLTPQQSDVEAPVRTPFGTGSHKMVIGQSTVQTELYRTPKYDGTLLEDVTRLGYSTFARRTAGTGALRQPTFLRLNVDFASDVDSDTNEQLFFFPANNAGQQAVANGVWQHWDVTGGVVNVNGDGGPGAAIDFATYVANHPGAKLVNNADANDGTATTADGGALALITGGENGGTTDSQANGEYFVDRVVVGVDGADTLFDLGANAEQAGATTQLVADPTNLQGWYHQAYDNAVYLDSNQAFVDGPGAMPAGGGSLRFALSDGTNPDRVELFRTTQFDGTLVRDLRTLKFNTFQRATGSNTTPQQPVYLRLSVDTDGDGALDDTLFYSAANNGTVAQSTWQTWDAAKGVWGVNGDQGAAGSVTLAQYVVAHPDAVIVKNADGNRPGGGVAFMVGAGGAIQMNGEYFLDDITIAKVDAATGRTTSATRFDLDSVAPSTSVGDARVLEGNRGAVVRFPVTLSRAMGRPVSVDFTTVDGTAKAGQDYKAASGTVTIPAGSTTGSIAVNVISDKVRERHEAFSVNLTSPGYGALADATAVGSIVNDDTRVKIKLDQVAKRHVEAAVKTRAAAAHATVKVFRVVKGDSTRVLKDKLDKVGQISTVLEEQFEAGTNVKLYATVRTQHGLYTSETVKHTVR